MQSKIAKTLKLAIPWAIIFLKSYPSHFGKFPRGFGVASLHWSRLHAQFSATLSGTTCPPGSLCGAETPSLPIRQGSLSKPFGRSFSFRPKLPIHSSSSPGCGSCGCGGVSKSNFGVVFLAVRIGLLGWTY